MRPLLPQPLAALALLCEPDLLGHSSGSRRPGRQGAVVPGPAWGDDQGADGRPLHRGHPAPGRLLLPIHPGPRQADERGTGRAGQGARRGHRRAPGAGRVRGRSDWRRCCIIPPQGSIKAKAPPARRARRGGLALARADGTGRAGGAAGGVPAGRPPGGLRPAHPGPGQLEARHRRRRGGRRARGCSSPTTRSDASRRKGSPGSGRSRGGRSRPAPPTSTIRSIGVKRAIAEAAAGVASRARRPDRRRSDRRAAECT